jgi:hypothetical protein
MKRRARPLVLAVALSISGAVGSGCRTNSIVEAERSAAGSAPASHPAAASASARDASPAQSLLACAVQIARQARLGTLSPNAAARICGGSVSSTEAPTSWSVKTRFKDLTVTANDAPTPEQAAAEYRLTMAVETPILLSDLAAEFGPYKKVFESKASGVSFAGSEREGPLFADLLSSKVLPGAAVIRLVARARGAR